MTFLKFFVNVHGLIKTASISWLNDKLMPLYLIERQSLYAENELIDAIYFIQKGSLAFV